MYHNVVIGTPLVEPWELLASDVEDWEANEKTSTLFTETRNLAKVMVEAGLAPSIGEVRRNKPKLYVELHQPNFFRIKWGKNFLVVLVGPDIPEAQFGEPEFAGDPWPTKKIGKANEREREGYEMKVGVCGNMEEVFKTAEEIQQMSPKEWKFYIVNTLSAAGKIHPRDWMFRVTTKRGTFEEGYILYPDSVLRKMATFTLFEGITVGLFERPWNTDKPWVKIAEYNGGDKWKQPTGESKIRAVGCAVKETIL